MRKWLLVGSMCAMLGISGCSGGDDSGTAAGSDQGAAAGNGEGAAAGNDHGAAAGSDQGAAAGNDQGAAAGNGLKAITGKWVGPKGGAANETFEFRGDGTVSFSGDRLNCRGAFEPEDQERAYSFQVSCGDGAWRSVVVVSPDGKTLTLTDLEGDKSDYERVAG